MSRRKRIILVALGVLAMSLLLTAAALANAFSQVYQSYRKSGHIDPCRFPVAVLNQAKAQVPPDIDQYAPDFPAALDAALTARARGQCGTPAGTAAATTPTTTAAAAPPSATGSGASPATTPAKPTGSPSASSSAASAPVATAASAPTAPAALAVAGHTSGASAGAPAAIIALAVLAGLLALAAGAWGLARWRGWDPPWLASTAHAFSEAAVRAEATWAEFTDWLRLGR